MKTRIIFNPHSGRNRRRPGLIQDIRDFISSRTLDAQLAITEGPGHATDLASRAVQEGCRVVVAVGGDGTMNEVGRALINTPAALALVPCGSGNGLALHLGLPLAPLHALQLATGEAGRVAAVDTGRANDHPFFNAMGLGLDAEVSHRFNRLTRRGLPAYARTALAALRSMRSERCVISCGAVRQEMEALLIAVANSDQYGNNARIAPGARVDDGALDLVAIKPVGLLGAAGIAARLFLGAIDGSPHVFRLRGVRFRIERSAPGLIHTDGETHSTGAAVIVEVNPRSLRIVIPATSRAVGVAAPSLSSSLAFQLP
jgi:YegS/Rv2252/BmrU family lipid kinase